MPRFKRKIFVTKEGKVSYKRTVVKNIVELACKEIGGVAGLSDKGFWKLKLWFSDKYYKGCKINFIENKVYIDVFVNVYFGYFVNDVSFRVQENIKSSVESMTEFKVAQINVNVIGVVFNGSENVAVL